MLCLLAQVVEPQLPSNADWREAGYRFLLEDEEGREEEQGGGSPTKHKPRRSRTLAE